MQTRPPELSGSEIQGGIRSMFQGGGGGHHYFLTRFKTKQNKKTIFSEVHFYEAWDGGTFFCIEIQINGKSSPSKTETGAEQGSHRFRISLVA